MSARIVRVARATNRVMLDIFGGIKSAMDIPPVAGLTYGLLTFLWLEILLPGGFLR